MVSVSCSSEEIEGSPDDIVFTPGGLAYRANVHAAGKKNPWPDIDSRKVILSNNSSTAQVSYRNYIETKAGETRNNLFYISVIDANINEVFLNVINIPDKIQISEVERARMLDRMDLVLAIHISQQAESGEYEFEVEVNINGEEYGKVPCIIKVLE
jgi:hypothetical protein